MKLIVIRDDPRGVLAPVLEHDESVVEIFYCRSIAGDGEDSAHNLLRAGVPARGNREIAEHDFSRLGESRNRGGGDLHGDSVRRIRP